TAKPSGSKSRDIDFCTLGSSSMTKIRCIELKWGSTIMYANPRKPKPWSDKPSRPNISAQLRSLAIHHNNGVWCGCHGFVKTRPMSHAWDGVFGTDASAEQRIYQRIFPKG